MEPGFLGAVRAGLKISSNEPVLGEAMGGLSADVKIRGEAKSDQKNNPFQEQLKEASQRLRNAQIAMMRLGGAREKMELQIAQQAFQTAHTLAIQFDNPVPSPSFSSAASKEGSGYDTDGSQSVSSASDGRTRSHPYARRLSKRERNKISATKYRQKKKLYVSELESKCNTLTGTVETLKSAVAALQSENKLLKEQMTFLKQLLQQRNGGGGMAMGAAPAPTPAPAPAPLQRRQLQQQQTTMPTAAAPMRVQQQQQHRVPDPRNDVPLVAGDTGGLGGLGVGVGGIEGLRVHSTPPSLNWTEEIDMGTLGDVGF